MPEQANFFSIFFGVMILTLLGTAACSTVREVPAVSTDGFRPSSTSVDSIVQRLPNYQSRLKTITGKGKAVVSEPQNSQRVTLYFSSNRSKSLITAKNSLGIEGGRLLTDGDTLLVYNKVDNYARKIALAGGQLQNINRLASINLLSIFNTPVEADDVNQLQENDSLYLLQLYSGTKVYVDKQQLLVQQISQPPSANLPYRRISYDAYDQIEGLTLPRRITIFSADGTAKVALLIQALQVNTELEPLEIEMPDDIKMYYQ